MKSLVRSALMAVLITQVAVAATFVILWPRPTLASAGCTVQVNPTCSPGICQGDQNCKGTTTGTAPNTSAGCSCQ